MLHLRVNSWVIKVYHIIISRMIFLVILELLWISYRLHKIILETLTAHRALKFLEKPLSYTFLMEHVSWCLNKRRHLVVLNVTIKHSETLAVFEGAQADATRLKSFVALNRSVFVQLICYFGNFA